MASSLASLLVIGAACIGIASNVSAQTSNQESRAAGAFEAASIKLAQPDTPYRSDNDLDGEEAWVGSGLRTNANFQAYMLFAYNITDSVRARAIWDALPSWAKIDKYEIQAVALPGVTRSQVRGMMQALLAERFALRAHTKTEERDALTLSLLHAGSTGPQLKRHPQNQPCLSDPNRPEEISEPERSTPTPRYCGVTVWRTEQQRHLQIVDATMPEIAEALANESLNGGFPTPHAGLEVSGLTGKYDLDLQYVSADRIDEGGGATFKEALKKQAGLVLVERKQPMQIIVIDHLERPTPN